MRDVSAAPEALLPAWVKAVVTRVQAHLAGCFDDLADVPIDVSDRPSFHCKVWEEARRIPPGTTHTYGRIAKALGAPGAARAVGQALGANPVPLIVPCHRVLAASGAGGFSAPGGVSTKARLLAIEGAPLPTVTPRRQAAGPRSATRGG
jgi:methylated-DNA-[protein]-cysteine S-methyltransferase